MASGAGKEPERGRATRTEARVIGRAVVRGRGLSLPPFIALPGLDALAGAFTRAAVRELEDRRGFLFAVLGLGVGVALYFGAEHEPVPYAAVVPAGLFGLCAYLSRGRVGAFHVFALLTAIACGFALASFQVQRVAHPVLAETLSAVTVSGYVEEAEKRPRGSRITLLVTGFGRAVPVIPERVRVTLTAREPPAVGSHVALRASLAPPPGPTYPGGFDFGRAAWFEGIGATGFALGKVEPSPAPGTIPIALAFERWLEGQREAIAARIRAAVPGEDGAIAVALVTGLRDAVPEPIEESMRVSGLSHVLSISGLHMALVATTVFFLVRALLALFPPLALHRPIKAWAAVPAVLAATYYLLLSGAEVPTQRSYMMTLLVLIGVIAARPALTLRTLALAALVVLVATPWAVLDPGAQMSFAATLALVALYERFGEALFRPAEGGRGVRLLTICRRYVLALVLTSLVAGIATAPFAAFHFQRLAPLSLIANLAAMPLVSFLIMPAGLIGALLMPFGWDGWVWQLMGWGIGMMVAISDAVAAFPGADRGMRAMPFASLILLSLALIGLSLLRTRLVLAAPVLIALALWIGWRAPMPDMVVDAQARTVGVRGADGQLHFIGDRDSRLDQRFAVEQWRAMEGSRGAGDAASADASEGSLAERRAATTPLSATARPPAAPACDAEGCTLRAAQGDYVAYSRSPASLEDDCRLASVVISTLAPPDDCAATVVHVDPRRQVGGLALYSEGGKDWRIVSARPDEPSRLWHPSRPKTSDARTAAPSSGTVAGPGGLTAEDEPGDQ